MKKLGVKGTSHVEMVLAMLMFIGVVLFVIFFLVKNDTKVKVEDGDFEKIQNYLLSEISEFYVYNASGDYVSVNVSGLTGNFSAIGEDGNKLKSDLSGVMFKVNRTGNNEILIVYGDGIWNNGSSVSGTTGTFMQGTTRNKKIPSQFKIERIKSAYDESRKEMNLGNLNFRVQIKNESGVILFGGEEIPSDLEVFKKSKKIEFVYLNGEEEFVNEEIYIW
ncbi:MAG: hypothetical protein AABX11_00775 [Nanoarchaeota archaeon]